MAANERKEIYIAALQKWGGEHQIIVAIEELSELQKALCKYLRGNYELEFLDNIVEEMADVQIMLEQMQIIFGSGGMKEWEEKKILRLNERVKKGKFK